MNNHINNLRWLGDQLDADASIKGIGQGSEGARYCWAAATEMKSLYDQLATAQARTEFLEAEILAEREACAKLCESLPVADDDVADACANAIRARSKKNNDVGV